MKKCIILIILICLLILGCQQNNDESKIKSSDLKTKITSPIDIEMCRSIEMRSLEFSFVSDKLICYVNYGKLHGNDNCNEDEKDICNYGVAVSENNLSYCKDVFCYLGVGLASGELEFCNQIEEISNKNMCVFGVAVANHNFELCETLGNETNAMLDLKNMCYLEVAKSLNDVELCNKLDSEVKEACYYMIAINVQDIALCNYSGYMEDDCREELNLIKAIETGNTNYCYEAGGPNWQIAECVRKIAVNKSDESICDKSPYYDKQCYTEVGVAKKDISMCEIGHPLNEGKECFERLTSAESYEQCKNLPPDTAIQCYLMSLCKKHGIKCYGGIGGSTSPVIGRAVEQNNASICEELDDLKSLCYYRFAVKLGFSLSDVFKYELFGQDEQICHITTGTMKEKCYFNLAIERLDESYCEKTGQYLTRCAENIFLINRNFTNEELREVIKSRKTAHSNEFDIRNVFTMNAGEFFVGRAGRFNILNKGDKSLDGRKLNLYKGFKLIDIDGCGDRIIKPNEDCTLSFNTRLEESWPIEVTCEGISVI